MVRDQASRTAAATSPSHQAQVVEVQVLVAVEVKAEAVVPVVEAAQRLLTPAFRVA